MNENIPIKISTEGKTSKQDLKKALNLNRVISEAKTIAKGSARKATFWKILVILLLLVAGALAVKAFWLDKKSFSEYQNIIPSQAQAVFFVNLDRSGQLPTSVMPGLDQNSGFYQWLNQKISRFLVNSNIDVQAEAVPSFKEEAAFMLFPKNASGDLVWTAVGQINQEQTSPFGTFLAKIQKGLKKNFGMNQLFYRQIQINSVYAFNKIEKPYYYSQVDNFVVVGNDLGAVEKIIDKIIGNGNLFGNFR